MAQPDFTEEEQTAVAAALRRLIDEDKFPFSPRLKPLKSALAKLAPPRPKAPPPPIASRDSASAPDHGTGPCRPPQQEYRRRSRHQPAHRRKPSRRDREENRLEFHSGAGKSGACRCLERRRQAVRPTVSQIGAHRCLERRGGAKRLT